MKRGDVVKEGALAYIRSERFTVLPEIREAVQVGEVLADHLIIAGYPVEDNRVTIPKRGE